ncbi:ThiF family adenylyltransferase [Amycolatopsis sp. cmx-4-68]|uniref:ThiF family adenylyltransferase n=1 Tax=Amycolatopsis sp. cmx-4-68 TaxID=2790938 RepID=UPI00397C3C12
MTAEPILVLPSNIESRLHAALFKGRGNANDEALGFLLCSKSIDITGAARYVVKEWIVPSSSECTERSAGGVSLLPAAHHALLERFLENGLHVVHLHSHPSEGDPHFSSIDDANELAYSEAIGQLPGELDLLSGVYNHSLTRSRFRLWQEGQPREVQVQRGWMKPGDITSQTATVNREIFARQQIFGADLQERFAALTVGLVGAGGLGSIFAEYASRLGVKKWILVDSDRLEKPNLNRAPFSTASMAERGWTKVRHVTSIVRRLWGPEATVKSFATKIPNVAAMSGLAQADVLVVATDNHSSRLEMLKLALEVGKPILSLGTYIDRLSADHPPRVFGRVTLPPLGGGWCLACGGAISLQQAAIEEADSMTREQLESSGYLADVEAPAVYWANGATAGIAAGLLHGMVANFGVGPRGVDYVVDYVDGQWLKLDHELTFGCYVCGIQETVGLLPNARRVANRIEAN